MASRMWIRLIVVVIVTATQLVQAGKHVPYKQGDSARFEDDLFGMETIMKVTAVPSTGWRLLNELPGLGALWVWTRPNNEQAYIWSTVVNRFQLLADFGAPVGTTFKIDLGSCNQGEVVLAASDLTIETPAGVFEDTARLDLQPNCADGGVTRMWFVPEVGIVRVEESNFAGLRTHELVEAELGGVVYPLADGLEVATKFPSPFVVIDREPPITPDRSPNLVTVSLAVTNHSNAPLNYLFIDGQRFDILVLDADGKVVSSWSRGRGFPDFVSTEVLEAGQTWKFRGRVPLTDDEGNDLPPGGYTLRIEMTSEPTEDTAHTPGSIRIGGTAPLQVTWAL